jgi:hypothetical protein
VKIMTADEIGSTPTGGLEMNFVLNREKANQINGRKNDHDGLNQTDSSNYRTRPTGGTISLKIEPWPRIFCRFGLRPIGRIKGLKVRLPKIYIAIFPNTVFRFIGITKSW